MIMYIVMLNTSVIYVYLLNLTFWPIFDVLCFSTKLSLKYF